MRTESFHRGQQRFFSVKSLLSALSLSSSRYVGIVLLLAIGVRLAWVLAIDTQPASDFLFMHTAALQVAEGKYLFRDSEYFLTWAYQIGFTLYEALIIHLLGTNLIFLKLFNILFSVGTAYLLYVIATHVFNPACGRIALLFYAMYVPNIILCSVLTNQHISTFLFVLGCYFVVRKGLAAKYDWLLVSLCWAIGNMFRPLGSFYLVGFLVYTAVFQIYDRYKKNKRPRVAKALGVLLVYFIMQQLISYAFVNTSFIQVPLANKEPYWKFVVGLNESTLGSWSLEDDRAVAQYPVGDERNRKELQMIGERIEDNSQLFVLFAKKFALFWGSADTSVDWSLKDLDKPKLSVVLIIIERLSYLALTLFGFLSVVFLLRKRGNPQVVFFLLLLLGYAALHLVIEIQARYRFDIMPCLFILQSYGVYVCMTYKKERSCF
ncbi:ArnT family glycosyltransferase [Paenibacillus ferrarius]|uniref:ArnT family glycosyltransferase n=1 Tax=Paenibacillus ferrarius TaxID=1469647 RepID=UPI0009A4FC03|nr:glycosyltransferase family 39 protein [Paenibacillus ferrarius]